MYPTHILMKRPLSRYRPNKLTASECFKDHSDQWFRWQHYMTDLPKAGTRLLTLRLIPSLKHREQYLAESLAAYQEKELISGLEKAVHLWHHTLRTRLSASLDIRSRQIARIEQRVKELTGNIDYQPLITEITVLRDKAIPRAAFRQNPPRKRELIPINWTWRQRPSRPFAANRRRPDYRFRTWMTHWPKQKAAWQGASHRHLAQQRIYLIRDMDALYARIQAETRLTGQLKRSRFRLEKLTKRYESIGCSNWRRRYQTCCDIHTQFIDLVEKAREDDRQLLQELTQQLHVFPFPF